MTDIKSKHLLFLLLFIFSYLLPGCGEKDNSSSTSANKKHIPISSPKPNPETKAKQVPQPKIEQVTNPRAKQTPESNIRPVTNPKRETRTRLVPDFKPDPTPIPTSKLIITTNQTNDIRLPLERLNLALANIKFTLIPEGKNEEIDIYLYPGTDNEPNSNQLINLDLTSLQDNQYMLVDAMAIPTGTITSILISFSGINTHIKLDHGNTRLLLDPFFSTYSTHDNKINGIRQSPAELLIKTHIELTKDQFEYINISIDSAMTVGLEPTNISDFIQFLPTATINTLPKDTDVPLVIINEAPLSTDNAEDKIRNILLNATTTPINMQAIDGAHYLTGHNSNHGQNHALFISTLSTTDVPSIAVNTIGFYPTKEQRSTAMESLNNQYQRTLTKPDKVFLYYRDTVNRANSFPPPGFKVLTTANTTASEVIFSLPKETYLLQDGGSHKLCIIEWLCREVLIFTNQKSRPLRCYVDYVETLRLNLDATPNGHFVILETGRTDIDKLTILPDTVHHFNTSDAFYTMLKDKLDNENVIILGLEIEGEFNYTEFTVTNSMKVILFPGT